MLAADYLAGPKPRQHGFVHAYFAVNIHVVLADALARMRVRLTENLGQGP